MAYGPPPFRRTIPQRPPRLAKSRSKCSFCYLDLTFPITWPFSTRSSGSRTEIFPFVNFPCKELIERFPFSLVTPRLLEVLFCITIPKSPAKTSPGKFFFFLQLLLPGSCFVLIFFFWVKKAKHLTVGLEIWPKNQSNFSPPPHPPRPVSENLNGPFC